MKPLVGSSIHHENDHEHWKDIKHYEGLYSVSNLGRVKSIRKVLSIAKTYRGYGQVTLYAEGFKGSFAVHRLVAEAFIPNPEGKPEVNHIDGNKLNNNISNLHWCTRSENERHAFDIGLKSFKGEKHNQSKLNDLQVRIIRRLKGQIPQREIAKMFGMTQQGISDIHRGKNWNHL